MKICVSRRIKVIKLDRKTLEVLKIKEGKYSYSEIINNLKSTIDEKKLSSICKNCSWYDSGICKEKILNL